MTNKASPTPEAREAGRKVSSARADARAIEFAAVEIRESGITGAFAHPPAQNKTAAGNPGL
jgi:hypothetical protein